MHIKLVERAALEPNYQPHNLLSKCKLHFQLLVPEHVKIPDGELQELHSCKNAVSLRVLAGRIFCGYICGP